jgi:hypothetical protein
MDDQIRLTDQMHELKDQHKRAQDAFDKILYWKSVYLEPPGTFPNTIRSIS